MKKSLLVLLALGLGLSACTPAESSAAASEPVTVEATGESVPAEEGTAFPVGHLRMIQYYESTADEIFNAVHFWNDAGELQLQLLEINLTNGQRTSLYFGACPGQGGVRSCPGRDRSACLRATRCTRCPRRAAPHRPFRWGRNRVRNMLMNTPPMISSTT